MPSALSIVIHGHFYQPPRENPWLEEIEREASAAPFHDWNERIERECYRAVVAARVLGPDGRITRIVNTLEHISFNFGPTLLEWLERAAPATYARVLAADRVSASRLGHGNAIAQPYHHAILPLSSRRDKVTEVRWGIADFRRRFGREPEGMWLPETALDDETLDVLAQEGIRFTIVAPGQVTSVPNDGHPGRYTTASGRTIALCVYDGGISHGIAFGGLLGDAHVWTRRLLARPERRRTPTDEWGVSGDTLAHHEPDPDTDGGTRPITGAFPVVVLDAPGGSASPDGPRGKRGSTRLVSAATDGETYGHHHRFGEMALARVIVEIEGTRGVRVENFSSYLARHPVSEDIGIVAPSAWSCAHGVERWRSNCSCRMKGGTNQEWRTPLRDAITALAEGLHAVYEREARAYFDDPWAVRDAYGEVVAMPERVAEWVRERVKGTAPLDSHLPPGRGLPPTPESLMEMERGALRIFTSCAWFFDDIGGLEPVEVLRYAARAIELAGADGARLEEQFLARLAEARSNDPALGTGRDVYLAMAKPKLGQLARVAGSVGAARLLAPDDPRAGDAGPALAVAADADWIVVRQRRTGEQDAFDVEVSGAPLAGDRALAAGEVALPATVTASVRPIVTADARIATGQGPHSAELSLTEMTERQRDVIADAIRARLIERSLDAATLGSLLRSGKSVRDVIPSTLHEAVLALRHDRSATAGARVLALLDLLELEGVHVPFDVQTAFFDVLQDRATPAAGEADLAALARRFGFAAEALPSPPVGVGTLAG